MTSVEPINLRVTASAAGLKSELGVAQSYVRSFAQQIAGQNRLIGSSLSSLSATLRSLFSLPTLVAGGSLGFGLKLAADAEQTEVAFSVMLGSAQRAQRVIKELTDFAAKTPFQLPEIRDAARLLLAFGFSAEELNEQLTVMGNLAAGINQPIGELAELIGKARVQNQIFSEDLNQLTGRGINVLNGLAVRFGVTVGQVKKLASEGKIQFADLNAVLKQLAGDGGQFGGLMAKQAQTASGALSSLTDNVGILAGKVSAVLLPQANKLFNWLSDLIDSLQQADTATVRNTASIVTFTGTFVATLAIIPRVVAAVRSIVLALRSLATATVTVQALSGPKGWATLAASLAAAAGAVYLLNDSFAQLDAQAAAALESANAQADIGANAANSVKNVDALANANASVNEQLEKQAELLKQIRNISLPSAVIRGSAAELQALHSQHLQSIRRADTGNNALLQETKEIAKQLRTANEELRRSNSAPPIHIT